MEPTSTCQKYITVTIEVTGSLIIKLWFVATSNDKKKHLIGWSAHAEPSREMKLQITLATPATGYEFLQMS